MLFKYYLRGRVPSIEKRCFNTRCESGARHFALAHTIGRIRQDAFFVPQKRKYHRKKVHPLHGRSIAFGF
jgi:hypothetical protein